MPKYNKKCRYFMLKNLTLASVWKWRHRVYPVSVNQLILIFLMAKILCRMTTAAVHG